MLVVAPKVNVSNLSEFIQYVHANPGRMSYASVGVGSASHLTMELFKSEAKLDIAHVPYRGFPPAVTDMLAGRIDAMFAIIPAVLPHVKAGKLKGIAVTGLKRSVIAPDVPSVAELGYPQLVSLAWIGLLAPAGTPQDVVSRLSKETIKVMHMPDVQDSLKNQGFDTIASSPEEFAKWIRSEQNKWGKVIKAVGATVN